MARVQDIRVALDMADHGKVEDLVGVVGEDAFRCLLRLWCRVAEHDRMRADGVLRGLDPAQIERRALWKGAPGQFFRALRKCKLLDSTPEGYAIHDWCQWQRFVMSAGERESTARLAAEVKHQKRRAKLLSAVPVSPAVSRSSATKPAVNPVANPVVPAQIPFDSVVDVSVVPPQIPPHSAVDLSAVHKVRASSTAPYLYPSPKPSPAPIPSPPPYPRGSGASFELRPETAGLLKPSSVEKALREKWLSSEPPGQVRECSSLLLGLLRKQRMAPSEIFRVLELSEAQLRGDPHDIGFRRLVAYCLEALRDKKVRWPALWVSKAKNVPATWALDEAKALIAAELAAAAPARANVLEGRM